MKLHLSQPELSPLQRRTILIFAACLALIAFVDLTWLDLAKHNPSIAVITALATAPGILVVAMIVAIGRYLARENDEFIRALVVVAMLWSFGAVMVVDTVLGVVLRNSHGMRIMPMLNIDLFCVVTPLALRIQLWRSR